MFADLRRRARLIKRDTLALYLAARHPATPWYAKALAVAIAGYALSPIDLIPDFIPLLGYLDDVILLPAAILLCVRLIPPAVLAAGVPAEVKGELPPRVQERMRYGPRHYTEMAQRYMAGAHIITE